MTRIALAVLLVLGALPASATDFSRAAGGTTGAEFLLFDTSARGVALGGAMTAITNDASSIYWNPAGLASVPRLSATFMHAQYVADITFDDFAYAQRYSDAAVAAAGVRYLDGGSIAQTDVNGLAVGQFHPRSYVAELGWGQSIYDLSDSEMDVAMGVSARGFRTDLGLATADGFGGDFGVQSRFYTSLLTYDLALVVQNMGYGQKFDQTRDSLPLRVKFAGAVQPLRALTLTAEAAAPINNSPYGAGGVEYSLDIDRGIKAAARAGVNTQTYQALGFASIMSFGLGLQVNDFTFDYAFAPLGPLGSATHRISFSYNLPAKVSRRYRER